jgi:hypothetical protein
MNIWKYKKEIIAMAIVLILLISLSYAYFTLTLNGTKDVVVKSGTLSVTLDDSAASGITLENAQPISEEEGLQTTAYTFTITNNGTLISDYAIYLDDVDLETGETRIDDSAIRYELIKNSTSLPSALLSTTGTNPNRIINSGTIATGVTDTYTLRVWIDYNAGNDSQGKVLRTKLRVVAGQYAGKVNMGTDTSNANTPVLIGDMIPVVYDETSGQWEKTVTSQIGWYNYDNQYWANAVTISDTTKRATYKSAAVGTAISMDDINAMFVWIPRYSYTIGNTYGVQGYGGSTPSQATPGAIDIKFVSTSTTDTGTATYTGSTASNYYTSPAFCWGDTCDSSRTDATNVEKSGIWVAKFETTAGASSTCTTTSNSTNCNLSTIVPVIKPNIASWRNVQVANMFTAIQTNMNSTNGTTNYGFSGTTYDTHMMKNTEWGAVAYLSQSKYGKYGNTTYSGADKEVAINNCFNFITGIAGDTVFADYSSTTCTTNTYNTTKGITASTTGNISGIYDMSGGAWEYVMGNMQISGNTAPMVGYNSSSTSGFAGTLYDGTTATGITFPSNKYYNKYTYGTSSTDYTRGILGDATKEMSPASGVIWYSDVAGFVSTNFPWFRRGGYYHYSTNAGVFYFDIGYGSALSYNSGRVVADP